MSRILPFLAVPALLCVAAPRPAQAAGAIRVSVTPNVLLADGVSSATVTAEVRTSNGRPARDGTEVRFYTTAGTITQVAFTSAGVARATLTASAVPQAANISVSAGLDQAVITVPMVSKLVETNVGGRVLNLRGEYVAFSEDKRFLQADGQVKVRFRGVEIEANSIQIDLNRDTLKALGKVNIVNDGKALVGERLWLDLKTFEGYMMAVGVRKWFSAYGITDLPEKPKNINPDFDLEDLTDSKLIWVSKQATYVINERVQIQGARAYVAGVKSFRMPFHESNLRVGFGETSQYAGFGTEGLTLDIPLYVRMTPGSTTALHVGYGAQTSGGIGSFSRQRGLRVDLVQKYGFTGASEGQASITELSSPDRFGFSWNHTQQLNSKTRLVSNLQFPQHRDLYGQLNLTSGLPIGTVQLAFGGSKPHGRDFAKTYSFAFETKPKQVAKGAVAVSAETSFFRREASEVRVARGLRVPLMDQQYQTLGVKLRPRSIDLPLGFTLDSSASLRAVSGKTNSGFGPAIETQFRKQLPNNGTLALGLNYNHLTTVNDLLPYVGKLNSSASLSYPVTSRLKVAALANMALDAESRNSLLQASYQLTPVWRLDFLHTLFSMGQFGNSEMQLGVARVIGNRELAVYWSQRESRFIVQFGASRF
ncbi:MAG: invasin domain 3-containing protein [Actinomycetota bacterium]